MFSKVFLAMTAGEMKDLAAERVAYMALHFSPYGTGLSNPPKSLPENSIIILDDSMQIENHDPTLVARQLKELVSQFSACAVLLDFQREKSALTQGIVSCILQALPCPVAVTETYAKALHCPVFLAPPPVNKPLAGYLSAWLKQGVYLEIAPETTQFTVTEKGSASAEAPAAHCLPLKDEKLHCHYNVEVFPGKAVFTLGRNREDLAALAQEAYGLGVQGVVGLYQELSK